MNEEKEQTGGALRDEVNGENRGVGSDAAASVEDESVSFLVRQGWMALALLLLAAAGVALALSHTDAAFVLGALGVCAWFLNLRGELKRKHRLKKTGRRNWEAR